jgi:cytochrome b6-f complex iron-sulfur subunit
MVRKISRRSFLVYFNIGWLVGCFPLVLSACQPKSPDSELVEIESHVAIPTDTIADGFTIVGTVADLDRVGQVSYQRVDYKKALVIRHPTQKAQLIALDPTCTHQGCVVKWMAAEKAFICPCHIGKFDLQGQVKSGPPPAPLKVDDVKVEGEKVLVKITV